MNKQIAALLALSLLASSFLAAGSAGAQTISDPKLFEQSQQAAQKALEFYGASDDPKEVERVAEIGYRVAKEANFTAFPLTFHVIDMPAPNAFALPGGQIFITRGMLELGADDDMMAGLLGHEIAHVVREHGVRMQRRSALLQALSQALVVGVLLASQNDRDPDRVRAPYDPRVSDNERANMVIGTAATGLVVSELLLRGYSRDFEREADDEGQRYSAAAGYDPTGLEQLMALMEERLPASKKYGYWQTHPFFDERVRSAATRAALLKQGDPESVEAYRKRVQATLLNYLGRGEHEGETVPLLKGQALTAWPRGEQAETIRRERLHAERAAELTGDPLQHDYGSLIESYEKEIEVIGHFDPESGLIGRLEKEVTELDAQRAKLYPKAAEVVAGGVYETPFLENFLSNFPDAEEAPKVALELGDAHSRLGNQTASVTNYLKAWETAPESDEGKRALAGLQNLAPYLDRLAALEQLASQQDDPELAEVAAGRLRQVATRFDDLANGAEYLKRYPAGRVGDQVTDRLNSLAEDLYAEVVLYQGVGDHMKALDRINSILTHAPLSPAAARIRDKAVVES